MNATRLAATLVLVAALVTPSAAQARFEQFSGFTLEPSTDLQRIAIADMTGDGFPDIVSGDGNSVRIHKNPRGKRSLIGHWLLAGVPFHPGEITLGDLDDDGRCDVLYGASVGWDGTVLAPPRLLLRQNSGAPWPDVTSERIASVDANATHFVVVDIDGDGHDDLVARSRDAVQVLGNNGNGRFSERARLTGPAGSELTGADCGDIDGDGDQDVVVLFEDGSLRLFRNVGGYAFEANIGIARDTVFGGAGVTLGDLDGDADLDLMIQPTNGNPRTYLNDGSGRYDAGRFASPHTFASGRYDLADIDSDGDLDITTSIRVLLNDGSANFEPGPWLGLPYLIKYVYALADLDRDGDVDVVHKTAFQLDAIWLNTERQLHAPFLSIQGQQFHVDIYDRSGSPGTSALPFVGLRPSDTDLPLATSTPFGLFLLDPAVTLVGQPIPFSGANRVTWSFEIPEDPLLLGTRMDIQAMLMENGNPNSWRLTNAIHEIWID